jgi:integrase
VRTLGDAINLVLARELANPRTKERTKESHKETAAAVRKTAPVQIAGGTWSKDAAGRWWRDHAAKYAASQANKALSLVKKAAALLIEAGVRHDDPTKDLKRMRVKLSAVDELPPMAKVLEVIEDIRGQRKRVSEESANMVAFLLWSGLRMGEVRGVQWEDVSDDWLTVRDGKSGRRKVPVSGPLREVIGRMTYEGAAGPVFPIKTPRIALGAACRRAGIGHLRMHDLRHLFATHAIESGVDIPTVAKWLGHKDRGALAMRTYGHIRDDHSLESIKKLG